MNDRKTTCSASTAAQSGGLGKWLRSWWMPPDEGEKLLAGASDLADLERRMRALERTSRGPAIVTFDH